MANLVTRISRDMLKEIETLIGQKTTVTGWVGLVARAFAESTEGQRKPAKIFRDKSTVFIAHEAVRIVASSPESTKATIRQHGLREAEWLRAVIRWALSRRLVPDDPIGYDERTQLSISAKEKAEAFKKRGERPRRRSPNLAVRSLSGFHVSGPILAGFRECLETTKLEPLVAMNEALSDFVKKHAPAGQAQHASE